MILSYLESERLFVCYSHFDERAVPKEAGFEWNPARKQWESDDEGRALRLEKYADPLARLKLNGAAPDAVMAATNADTTISIPAPDGLNYLPYQRAGITTMLGRDNSLCADEMGLGKTIQAIGVVNATLNVRRVLIICPASLRLNWQREWKKWSVAKINPVIVTDTWHKGIATGDGIFEAPPCAIIISYQGAVKWRMQIEQTRWDILITDEVHACKNASTQQTKAVLGGLPVDKSKPRGDKWPPIAAKRRVMMTGTPIVNRPEELWPLLRVIDRHGIGRDRDDYMRRYVLPPDVPLTVRYKQVETYRAMLVQQRQKELHDRLRSSIMVRRLKADVLKDLPSKRRQIILVEPANAKSLIAAENAVLNKKRAELMALKHENAVQKLQVFRGAALAEISRIRHETALAKVPAVIEHLYDMLDQVNKIFVCVHHHDVADAIAAALPAVTVQFDGRVDQKERDARVTRFQTDKSCRVFVGSIRAAGLGLTLTAASVVLFAELDWTPAAMVQAEDRLHRIGQKDSVLVHHLVIDGSIDQKMAQILIDKSIMIDSILDGKVPETMNHNILDEVLK